MRLSTLTPEEVVSHSVRVVNLLDLAGDEKYLKTTGVLPCVLTPATRRNACHVVTSVCVPAAVLGLMGQCPDYAVLVVDAGGGIQRMTKEHLAIALALQVPTFVAITKIDTQPPERVAAVCADVQRLIGVRGRVCLRWATPRPQTSRSARGCAGRVWVESTASQDG